MTALKRIEHYLGLLIQASAEGETDDVIYFAGRIEHFAGEIRFVHQPPLSHGDSSATPEPTLGPRAGVRAP